MAVRTVPGKFYVNGVLTNATTAKLSDPTGTFGVKRNDTDAAVVADGTAMTNDSTGVYSYTFTDPGVAMTAWLEFVYAGSTTRVQIDLPAHGITTPASASLCTVQFRVKLSDTAVSGAVCKAKLLGINQASDGTILSNAESSDTTDAQGIAELQLVQKGSIVKGSGLYKLWVLIAGQPVASVETTIPNQATLLFEDILK